MIVSKYKSRGAILALLGFGLVGTLKLYAETLAGLTSPELIHQEVVNMPQRTETQPVLGSTETTSSGNRFYCTPHIDSLVNVIQRLPPVFIFMPAKAGGSSVKRFANNCYADTVGIKPSLMENFVNDQHNYMDYLLQNLQVPKIVASHLYYPTPLMNAMQRSSRETVFIYIYGTETDRLMSGIQQMAFHTCTEDATSYKAHFGKPIQTRKDEFGVNISWNNGTKIFTLNEELFVEKVIKERKHEIGFSVPSQLRCDVWSELEETGPSRFFFIHYTALDQVQAKLASYYCPNIGLLGRNSTR